MMFHFSMLIVVFLLQTGCSTNGHHNTEINRLPPLPIGLGVYLLPSLAEHKLTAALDWDWHAKEYLVGPQMVEELHPFLSGLAARVTFLKEPGGVDAPYDFILELRLIDFNYLPRKLNPKDQYSQPPHVDLVLHFRLLASGGQTIAEWHGLGYGLARGQLGSNQRTRFAGAIRQALQDATKNLDKSLNAHVRRVRPMP